MAIQSAWAQPLQSAKFKGIPFEVTGTDYQLDRRVVVHEIPFADYPITEDLGLNTQQIKITGFLNGRDVYSQRDQLAKITKEVGRGELVHPSLGSLNVALLTCGFSETIAEGGNVELSMTFVVIPPDPPKKTVQNVNTSTSTVLQSQVANVQAAAKGDFFSNFKQNLNQGVSQIQGVYTQVNGYVSTVRTVMNDASRIVHSVDGIVNMVPGLSGSRFARVTSSITGLGAINGILNKANLFIGTANRVGYAVSNLESLANKTYRDVNVAADRTMNLVSKL